MNYYPKLNRKKFTGWCEECDLVFDNLIAVNEHQEKEKTSYRDYKNRILGNGR
jgi:hypothetical protein